MATRWICACVNSSTNSVCLNMRSRKKTQRSVADARLEAKVLAHELQKIDEAMNKIITYQDKHIVKLIGTNCDT